MRAHKALTHTQLDELQFLLPEYKFKHYLPLQRVKDQEQFHSVGWEWEGIGFLSKFRILNTASMNHSIPLGSADQAKRAFLYTQFYIEPDELEINVIFIQMSHDQRTQVYKH